MWILGLKGYKKIYSRKGKLNEKKFLHPINPKEFDDKKKFLRLENYPLPP